MSKGKHLKEKKGVSPWIIANIAAVALLFAGITISLLVFERPVESQIERRELAKFPEFSVADFFSGDFTDGVTEWFDDTVPWRDGFKNISSNITKYMGVSFGGVTVHGGPAQIVTTASSPATEPPVSENSVGSVSEATETSASQTTEATTTSYDPKNEIAPGVQTNGQLVMKRSDGHYWACSMYGGGYSRDTFVEQVNAFAEDLGDDVQVYVMTAPTSGEYYIPHEYDQYNASQKDDIFYMADHFSDKVINVDCYSVLLEHSQEPIYLRTDYHWQPLGAYYAAEAFAKTADVPFADISQLERVDVEGYMGSMYSTTQDGDLLNDPETFTYYKPTNKYTTDYYDTSFNIEFEKWPFFIDMPVNDSYSMFMGGDRKIVKVTTDVNNGRKLVVFKDSYGNAEIPFYMNSFEEIYVCDIRYFDINAVEFIKEQGVTDLLFSMCTFSAAGVNCEKYMEKIRTQ